ncbi:MAG: hypothetical protein IT372_36635 [Polyangiaceae bacterium]|nr:hypothetical protein [Polyangiaceae bacterium]
MAVRKTRAPVYEEGGRLTADELPVTRRMLVEVRGELLSRIDQTKEELKADIQAVKVDVHGVKADVARMLFLMEDQNARNKVVLDGLSAFMDRQTRVEQRMDVVEATVRDLAASRPPGTPDPG